MKKIVLSNNYKGATKKLVSSLVPEGFTLHILENFDSEELKKEIVDADYLIVSGRMKITSEVLEHAKCLKMIQRTGVGLDHIDLEYLKDKQIPLYVNQGVNALSVAEHAMMLILATMKHLNIVDRKVKAGIWEKQNTGIQNFELANKTVGIVGAGHIGRCLMKMLNGFHVNMIYYDPYRLTSEQEKELHIQYVSLEELCEKSDVISLHCPLTSDTKHLFGKEQFEKMKNSAFIINTSRGGLIDTFALYEAIMNQEIAGAGLDVFEEEPLSKDSKLLSDDRIITTCHIAGITYESFTSMISKAFSNIACFDAGKLDEIAQSAYFK